MGKFIKRRSDVVIRNSTAGGTLSGIRMRRHDGVGGGGGEAVRNSRASLWNLRRRIAFFHLDRDTGTSVMRLCNHCNGQLGLIVRRKRMLRFCSKACKKAYEHKLDEERRAKLRHLAFLARGAHPNYWAGSPEYPS
jgi:hypothetical protein